MKPQTSTSSPLTLKKPPRNEVSLQEEQAYDRHRMHCLDSLLLSSPTQARHIHPTPRTTHHRGLQETLLQIPRDLFLLCQNGSARCSINAVSQQGNQDQTAVYLLLGHQSSATQVEISLVRLIRSTTRTRFQLMVACPISPWTQTSCTTMVTLSLMCTTFTGR
jgi:hypothetical protein